jgi:hypothetical protein
MYFLSFPEPGFKADHIKDIRCVRHGCRGRTGAHATFQESRLMVVATRSAGHLPRDGWEYCLNFPCICINKTFLRFIIAGVMRRGFLRAFYNYAFINKIFGISSDKGTYIQSCTGNLSIMRVLLRSNGVLL